MKPSEFKIYISVESYIISIIDIYQRYRWQILIAHIKDLNEDCVYISRLYLLSVATVESGRVRSGCFIVLNNSSSCERRELPSQYGRPKKRNKIFNIGRRTILFKTFSYSFSILNWFQTWTGPARSEPAKTLAWHIWSRFSEAYFSVPVEDTSFCS